MAEVKFIFEDNAIKIQCIKQDLMRDICIKFANKLKKDINKLYFLYGGSMINLNLKLEQLINDDNEINILAYEEYENNSKCPNCGPNIDIKTYDDIILSNKNIIETLIGLKSQLFWIMQ